MACSSDIDLRIIMIGKTGTGKSSTANTILNQRGFTTAPGGSSITKECKRINYEVFGRSVSIVDTPGLYDTQTEKGNTLKEIVRSIAMVTPGPHAILFILPIGRCTKEEINTINTFMAHFGERLRKYIITVFTRYDDWKRDTDDSFNTYIDTLPDYAKTFIRETCDSRFIPIDNTLTGNTSEHQARAIIQAIDEMVAKNGGECYSDENFREAERILKEKEKEALQQIQKVKEQHENELKNQIELQLKEERKKWKNDMRTGEQEYRKQTDELLKSQRELFEKEIVLLLSRNEPNGVMNTILNGIKIVRGITDTVSSFLDVWDKTHIHQPKEQPQLIPLSILLNQHQECPYLYQRQDKIFNYGNFLQYRFPHTGYKCETSGGDVD